MTNVSLFEEQLRKIRDTLEDREKENISLQKKLTEVRCSSDNESNRLNEDKERLRLRISQLEIDHLQELDN